MSYVDNEHNPKELKGDLVGTGSNLDPWFNVNSAARKAMFATHIGQAPVVKGAEPRRNMTGFELEYARHTFKVAFPEDAQIIRAVRKYPPKISGGSFAENPLTVVIYENFEDKVAGVLEVPLYHSLHQDFGFRYKRNREVQDKLFPGSLIPKDEPIATSPAVTQDGLYGMGVEVECAFLSMPGTIEDGFIFSESLLEKMTATGYHTRVGGWGRKAIPLNIYGDEKTYKPFPDIGDVVPDHGVIFATRDYNENLAPAEMTSRALRTIDYAFDNIVTGKPGARVIDITVYHDSERQPAQTPESMCEQARRYYDAQVTFYQTIIEEYQKLFQQHKRRGRVLQITPQFNQLLVEAYLFLPVKEGRKLSRMYRLDPLDEWRVEVTYEYEMKPSLGYKYTDFHGIFRDLS